ncbi:hypothetical protein CDAR_475521 [Caerostris darwini]|uniref:Uncharacterized protein n=1 Tax=Caerostris darwini TaxID=1538125 RepID=A0AAV4P8J9_9ARAC|nr:hypothetical protein CDAR_475521 [Caerostris darwini]
MSLRLEYQMLQYTLHSKHNKLQVFENTSSPEIMWTFLFPQLTRSRFVSYIPRVVLFHYLLFFFPPHYRQCFITHQLEEHCQCEDGGVLAFKFTIRFHVTNEATLLPSMRDLLWAEVCRGYIYENIGCCHTFTILPSLLQGSTSSHCSVN